MARAYNSAHPNPQYKAMQDAADVEVARWTGQVAQTRKWEAESGDYANQGQTQLARAQAPIAAAETEYTRANNMNALSERLYSNANQDTRGSRRDVKTAAAELKPYAAVEDGRSLEQHQAWEKAHLPFFVTDADDNLVLDESGNARRSMFGTETFGQALQGKGPSGSYGVKRANARLLTGDIMQNNIERQAGQEAGQGEVPGGPLGVWSSTMDDDAIDWKGKSGRGEAGYAGQLQGLMDSMVDSLPPPPKAGAQHLDAKKLAWDELETEKQALGGLKAETAAGQAAAAQEAAAAEGVKALAEKNKAQAGAQQDALADKQSQQSTLQTQTTDAKADFDQSGAKADQGGGLVGSFVGKFLTLMGMIPSKLMPGASAGTEGAKKLQAGVEGGSKASATGQQAVQQVSAAGAEFSSATANANTQAQEVSGSMDSLGGVASQDKALADQGRTELAAAEGTIDADLASMEAEQARLAAEHDGWAVSMMNWSQTHEARRTEAMGELDGIVSLVDTEA